MEPGEKYLSGEINLGLLGRVKVYVFTNTKREKEEQPHFNICVKTDDGAIRKVGGLWKQAKKEPEETQVVEGYEW